MNAHSAQQLQTSYLKGQSLSLRSGYARTDRADARVHRQLNRLLILTGGMFVAGVGTAVSVALLFF